MSRDSQSPCPVTLLISFCQPPQPMRPFIKLPSRKKPYSSFALLPLPQHIVFSGQKNTEMIPPIDTMKLISSPDLINVGNPGIHKSLKPKLRMTLRIEINHERGAREQRRVSGV